MFRDNIENINVLNMFKFKRENTRTTSINLVRMSSAFSCSKLTLETLEQGVKYVQS